MALTDENRQYFDQLDEMMGTDGWRRLIEDASSEITQIQGSALEAASYEELMFMRGQSDILSRLVSLRDISEATRSMHEEEDIADL